MGSTFFYTYFSCWCVVHGTLVRLNMYSFCSSRNNSLYLLLMDVISSCTERIARQKHNWKLFTPWKWRSSLLLWFWKRLGRQRFLVGDHDDIFTPHRYWWLQLFTVSVHWSRHNPSVDSSCIGCSIKRTSKAIRVVDILYIKNRFSVQDTTKAS